MSVKSFHHVAIKSAKFEESLKFYTEVLGLRQVNSWGSGENRGVMLALADGSHIELFDGGKAIKDIQSPIIHIAFSVDDPDYYIEKVRAYGMEVTMEPNDIDVSGTPGFKARIAFCKGIDGELLEFFA